VISVPRAKQNLPLLARLTLSSREKVACGITDRDQFVDCRDATPDSTATSSPPVIVLQSSAQIATDARNVSTQNRVVLGNLCE
jgi:hypothetical protein